MRAHEGAEERARRRPDATRTPDASRVKGGVFAVAVSAVVALVGSACGQTAAPPKEPEGCKIQMVDLTILASGRINPTELGEARPVQVRLYQLANETRLERATFQSVWKDDKAALEGDLIKSEELSVYPASRTDITFERDEKAMVIAAVALFRTPRGRSWYTTFELPPAPGKGACGPTCPNGECADAGPKTNPHFIVWMDGTRVDEGSDHIDEYPRKGRNVEMHVPFTEPSNAPPPPVSTPAGREEK